MATYKKEKGFAVQTLASDTAASGISAASWASGGNMNTGRYLLAGCGAAESALLGAKSAILYKFCNPMGCFLGQMGCV